MKILITGIAGFVGSHLADLLTKKKNIQLFGVDIPRCNLENIKHLKQSLKFIHCDICNFNSVSKVIKTVNPDVVFHLAAQVFVPESWSFPTKSLTVNIIGQVNILEAVRKIKKNIKVHIAGSAEEYGLVFKNELPVKENNQLRPLSPYAVGKVAQGLLGFQYYQSYGMDIILTRAFNHLGPRMRNSFVASSFARQIALIEKHKQDPNIYTGDVNAVRDFTDVRDMVRAYWLAIQKCETGEAYNICSGKGHKIRDVLNILLSFTKKDILVKKDNNLMRPSDVKILIGDSCKFCKQTGWEPKISLRDTLKDILNYWRDRV